MRKAMRLISGIFLAVMMSALLTACGGGGGGGGGGSTSKTGVFANVSGLGYSAGSQTGTTKASGAYAYVTGDTATFKVGDIIIGAVDTSKVTGSTLTPLHLFPGKDAADPTVVNVMRFMMSIGTYDAADLKIVIPAAVSDKAKGITINFAAATDQELLVWVRQLTGNSSAILVDAATATGYLSALTYKYYGSTYTGSFSGPSDSKYWELTINVNDGTVAGMALDGPKETLTGLMSEGVNFTARASGGCVLTGQLNVFTGVLSGTWQYPLDSSQNGTFTGKRK